MAAADIKKMLIAGGGTGGHLFPGIAIAEEFLKTQGREVLFIGINGELEINALGRKGYPLRTIVVGGIRGKSLLNAFKALLRLPLSIFASVKIIREFSPDIVVGVGGYVSGPAALAGKLLGLPTAIAEQNALPGLTNRVLSRIADKVFISFENTEHCFPRGKSLFTGNPIRGDFCFTPVTKGDDGKFTILIFGGSQGARAINQAVMESLPFLAVIKDKLTIIHQCGKSANIDEMRCAYAAQGFTAEVLTFIDDMMAAYARADLVICRAGATTIAELTAAGKAAVLIPFPLAVGDHQTQNAMMLVENGAGIILKESDMKPQTVAELIISLCNDDVRLQKIRAAVARLGKTDAAQKIVAYCVELCDLRRK